MTTYTHGHAESVLRSHRSRTAQNSAAYLLPHLKPGLRVLDVGSGPGTITVDLADIVAPGQVTATEISRETAAITQEEAERQGVSNVEVTVADVHALQFADDSFDVVHAHQVLQHVADPVQALREMIRVCRPGGVVAARDSDYNGFVWYPQLPGLDLWLKLYCSAARANGGEPDAGRRLLSWARAAGAQNVTASSSTWCHADPPSRAYWGGMWADRILNTAISRQLVTSGLATQDDLESVSAAWRAWAADEDGWISIVHGEILIQVPPSDPDPHR